MKSILCVVLCVVALVFGTLSAFPVAAVEPSPADFETVSDQQVICPAYFESDGWKKKFSREQADRLDKGVLYGCMAAIVVEQLAGTETRAQKVSVCIASTLETLSELRKTFSGENEEDLIIAVVKGCQKGFFQARTKDILKIPSYMKGPGE